MAPSPLLVRPGGLPLLHVLLVPPLAPLLLPLILFLLPPRLRRACGGLLPLPVAVLLRWRQLAPRCAARLGLRDGPAPRPLQLPLLLRLRLLLLLLLARMLRWRPPALLCRALGLLLHRSQRANAAAAPCVQRCWGRAAAAQVKPRKGPPCTAGEGAGRRSIISRNGRQPAHHG